MAKSCLKHKMYSLFHICDVENFFTRRRCSVIVKLMHFTKSLQGHNRNAVLALTKHTEAVAFDRFV